MSGAMAMVSVTAALFVLLAWGCGLAYIFQSVDANYAYDTRTFATLPVSYEGRTQPLDIRARKALKLIAGRESLLSKAAAKRLGDSLVNWMFSSIADKGEADSHRSSRTAEFPRAGSERIAEPGQITGIGGATVYRFKEIIELKPNRFAIAA